MDVAPHPHIGLQTVTWLLDEQEVLHDDSIGSQSVLRPGGVNVMASGGGIAHAEQTPRSHRQFERSAVVDRVTCRTPTNAGIVYTRR